MYAVVATGGKQYRVSQGDLVKVEKLNGDPGSSVVLGEVLLIGDQGSVRVGKPHLSGASVTAEIVRHDKHDKVTIYKFRKRKGYRHKAGHRQPFTELKITGIAG